MVTFGAGLRGIHANSTDSVTKRKRGSGHEKAWKSDTHFGWGFKIYVVVIIILDHFFFV